MKRSEAMEMYKDSIIEEMRRAYYSVCKAHGNFSISIYVWEDGEIETLIKTGSEWLQARDAEPRQLFFCTEVWTDPYYDVWESCPDPKPEDEKEAEKMEEELLQEVVDWYDPETALDAEIEQAKQDEKMEEWERRYYA